MTLQTLGVKFEDLLVAADEGSPEAQYAVGMCYLTGVGVERDSSKGVRYLQLAAYQGYLGPQVKKDTVKEASYYIRRVNEKLPPAKYQYRPQLSRKRRRHKECSELPHPEDLF